MVILSKVALVIAVEDSDTVDGLSDTQILKLLFSSLGLWLLLLLWLFWLSWLLWLLWLFRLLWLSWLLWSSLLLLGFCA